MNINARGLHFKDLNAQIRAAQARDIVVENCLGQRYIGSGLAAARTARSSCAACADSGTSARRHGISISG